MKTLLWNTITLDILMISNKTSLQRRMDTFKLLFYKVMVTFLDVQKHFGRPKSFLKKSVFRFRLFFLKEGRPGALVTPIFKRCPGGRLDIAAQAKK